MQLVLIAHNIRSTYNVGSILRTADGFGVRKVYFSGYTPYPEQRDDPRLPHIRQKITSQIHKTALGAEVTMPSEFADDIFTLIKNLRDNGFTILALEQNKDSILLPNIRPTQKTALLLGEEVNGISDDLIKMCDMITEIPMQGKKESFNVSVATGIALYELTRPR
ncbi:MAG TPA: TrmH family RNA methyltransferase [Candidatus Saccharimonadales bacterium]|nr:TrmH family RNA methyltransferase [Candidatus Saccharimonadales bacterium]